MSNYKSIGVLSISLALFAGACSSNEDNASEDTTTTSEEQTEVLEPVIIGDAKEGDSKEEKDAVEVKDSATSNAISSYIWYTIGLNEGDPLNIRDKAGLDSKIVGKIKNLESVTPTAEVVSTGQEIWRKISYKDTEGWVNDRFLIAQPKDITQAETDETLKLAEEIVGWVGSSESGSKPIADNVWLRNIHNWEIVRENTDSSSTWNKKDFLKPSVISGTIACYIPEEKDEICATITKAEYIGLDDVSEGYEYSTNESELGLNSDIYTPYPDSFNWVSLSNASTIEEGELDWSTSELIFDWRTGSPMLAAVTSMHWTP